MYNADMAGHTALDLDRSTSELNSLHDKSEGEDVKKTLGIGLTLAISCFAIISS